MNDLYCLVFTRQNPSKVKSFIQNTTNKPKLNVLLQASYTINVNPSYRLLTPNSVIYDLILKHTAFLLLLFLCKWYVNIFYSNKIFTDTIIVYLATIFSLSPSYIYKPYISQTLCFKYYCVILYKRERERDLAIEKKMFYKLSRLQS